MLLLCLTPPLLCKSAQPQPERAGKKKKKKRIKFLKTKART